MAYKRISPEPVVEGGTGAQTFTSNGVLIGNGTSAVTATAAGTTGQVLTGNTGSAPTFQAPPASGAMVLLSTQSSATQVANFTFNSTFITTTYNAYFILINRMIPVTGSAQLLMDWSHDNGSTYFNSNYNAGGNSSAYNSASLTNFNSTTTCPLSTAAAGTLLGISAYIYYYPTNAGGVLTNIEPSYIGRSSANLTQNAYFMGVNSGGTSVNNIRFTFSTGNISQGTISLYGIAT